MNEHEVYVDITDDVVAYIVSKYDEIGVERILIAFKEIERRGIRELYARMYKKFPYNANSKTALSTDASERKIRRIVNK